MSNMQEICQQPRYCGITPYVEDVLGEESGVVFTSAVAMLSRDLVKWKRVRIA